MTAAAVKRHHQRPRAPPVVGFRHVEGEATARVEGVVRVVEAHARTFGRIGFEAVDAAVQRRLDEEAAHSGKRVAKRVQGLLGLGVRAHGGEQSRHRQSPARLFCEADCGVECQGRGAIEALTEIAQIFGSVGLAKRGECGVELLREDTHRRAQAR